MVDVESIKNEIMELIETHHSGWVKAAFYSDPQVAEIMNRLVERWTSNGERGRPIDYASEDELLVLLHAARKYYRLSPQAAMAVAFSNMSRGKEDRGAGLLGVFRKLFSRGRPEASP